MSLLLTGGGKHGVFTPLSLGASLKAWWSADDHGTANMTDDGSGLISSWIDKVGGINATATLTLRPTWSATGWNSAKPAVAGDGVANLTSTSISGVLPTGSTAGRIYVLAQIADLAISRCLMGYGTTGGGVSRRLVLTASEQPQINDGTTAVSGSTGTTSRHLFEGQMTGTTANGWVDGNAFAGNPATIASLNTGTERIRLFANNNTAAGQISADTIRHIIITLDDLTAGQIASLRAWFVSES